MEESKMRKRLENQEKAIQAQIDMLIQNIKDETSVANSYRELKQAFGWMENLEGQEKELVKVQAQLRLLDELESCEEE